MFLDKLEEQVGFSNVEKIIAEYILKNPFEIRNLTAKELAKVTYTSKASIFRFCKKIGANGFDKFKLQIEIEANERYRLKKLLEQEPIKKYSNLNEIMKVIPLIYDTSVNETRMKIDRTTLSNVVDKLHNADVIDIYCGGITYGIAESAKFKFLTLGLICNVHTGINEHYIMSNRKKKTVAIVLSFTGGSLTMKRVAKYLEVNKIYVIGIGGLESNAVKEVCNDYFEIYNKQLILSMEFINPYISMQYIFDIIFSALMVKNYDENLKHSLDVINNRFTKIEKILK
ncbi:MAG: MurR/RpiR family transcriptional regulator [Erysipelotrichaceae bacterium]|nr:MurR/RpiR family transcriptional regulator [Erysipelotrichaceae bacterium]